MSLDPQSPCTNGSGTRQERDANHGGHHAHSGVVGGGRAHAQTGLDATAPHFSSTSREPGGRPSAFCRNTTSCPGVHLPERPTMCRRRDGKPAEREHGVRGKGGGPRKRVQERFQSPEVLAVRRVPAGSGEKVPERGLRLETGERLSI